MKNSIKKFLFVLIGSLVDTISLVCLALICIVSRWVNVPNKSIFMGMMHINNWTYVAKAMQRRGYIVKVVPWLIPEHERGVIPYDVDLKKEYPKLYSNFIGQYILSFLIFIWAILSFRIFVLPFRNRILDRTVWLKWFEIPLLHLARKKVILNTFGGDVATPRLRRRKDLKYSLFDGYKHDPNYAAFNERAIARNTRCLEKQADRIVSAIDHIDYLDRVDDYFHLRCIDTDEINPNYVANKIPEFVHAPNHRIIKGTEQIIRAVDSLNKRGFPCKLRIVENTSNKELLKIISGADAVIDQLLLGTYARLSIESMALGKPVFCYMRPDLYEHNKIWKYAPIINVNPDNIEQELEKFIKLKIDKRLEIGKAGRHFVENYHSLEYVGERFDRIVKELLVNG